MADILRQLNSLLSVRQVYGSTYSPQSQGVDERMHGTMSAIVRGLVDGHPEDWEEMLPYAQGILRMTPHSSLGGRSPYQVVTGIRPALPKLIFRTPRSTRSRWMTMSRVWLSI